MKQNLSRFAGDNNLENFNLLQIIFGLIGPTEPRGESNHDAEALKNLEAFCYLNNAMISHVDHIVAKYYDDKQGSVIKVVDVGKKFLQEITDDLDSNEKLHNKLWENPKDYIVGNRSAVESRKFIPVDSEEEYDTAVLEPGEKPSLSLRIRQLLSENEFELARKFVDSLTSIDYQGVTNSDYSVILKKLTETGLLFEFIQLYNPDALEVISVDLSWIMKTFIEQGKFKK